MSALSIEVEGGRGKNEAMEVNSIFSLDMLVYLLVVKVKKR
jgi:hypothetical protein